MKKHWAIYGAVRMLRVHCSECGGMALVVKGIKQCCDKPVSEKANNIKVMSIGGIRKRPGKALREEILKVQENRCLYCGERFGTPYLRNDKILYTKLCFDHLIPYVYSQNNKRNFVAACHICNGIKSSKMFNTVEEVYHYVKYNREKKGIKFLHEENLSAVQTAV